MNPNLAALMGRITHLPLLNPQVRQRRWQADWRGRYSQLAVETWYPETQWHLPLTQV